MNEKTFFILRLVLELAYVEIFGDGRVGIGGNFDQVQPHCGGLFHGFGGQHDAQVFPVLIDYAHLGRDDEFIESGAVHRRRLWTPGKRGTYSCFS
jgi:hypothetical protein